MKKVVVIGPESTGKSSLCAALAKHYNGVWCSEYARTYLTQNGTNYTYNDLLTIAKGQIDYEDATMQVASNTPITFIDTDMYVMKTWCEYVFHDCHHFILQEIAKRNYDFYLLCNIDLPWTKDELREYPDLKIREQLFYHYKDIVINSGVPWALVSGIGNERTQCAIDAIDKIVII